MHFHKIPILLVSLGLVSSLPEPEPGVNVNVRINVNKNGGRIDKYGPDNTELNIMPPNEKDDAVNDVNDNPLETPAHIPAVPVPCQESGGQIQSKLCCPWYSEDPDLCTSYDTCVCEDGFVGEECEHDCKNNFCIFLYEPVCGTNASGDGDITFSNKCDFLTSQCKDESLYLLYDGACQDDKICPRINCPMDVAVVYYDNPDMPGCKLCSADTNAIC